MGKSRYPGYTFEKVHARPHYGGPATIPITKITENATGISCSFMGNCSKKDAVRNLEYQKGRGNI
jgi:hypothetical protein